MMLGEVIAFYVVSLLILVSALMVVTRRNLFHCALFLALVFAGVAGLFILLNAEFLAGVQLLIYAGAVTVLLLFAIMLSEEIAGRRIPIVSRNELIGALAALGFAICVVGLVVTNYATLKPLLPMQAEKMLPSPLPEIILKEGNIVGFGALMLTKFIVPFEFASILLLIALVGAIVIARRAE